MKQEAGMYKFRSGSSRASWHGNALSGQNTNTHFCHVEAYARQHANGSRTVVSAVGQEWSATQESINNAC